MFNLIKNSFNKLLLLGLFAELIVFIGSYYFYPELNETFKYAARYSGRISLLVFLYCFYSYTFSFPKPISKNVELGNFIKLFAILHIIHFGFLATNIYLNNIELVPIKLLGGFIAYLMIVIAPFILHKVTFKIQLLYFYYVTLVMIITYVARIKGDFEGAEPFWFHYVSLGVLVFCSLTFGVKLYKLKRKK